MRGIGRRGFLGAGGLLVPAALASGSASAGTAVPDPAICKQAAAAAIWRSDFDNRRIWGFVDRHSIEPGEDFDIMLSTAPDRPEIKGVIEIFRIGYYDDGDRKLVWRSDPLIVTAHEVQITSAALGVDWPPAIDHVPTDDWVTGYYTIDFVVGDNDRDSDVAYIVVTNPDRSGDILVGLSTNTYNAYNAWGGYSLYESAFAGDRAQMVSFDRPSGAAFFDYEYYLVTWLERIGVKNDLSIDYATNFDIHRDPKFAEGCKLFISGSHNEYWSMAEFEAIRRRIFEAGKSTMFMGANTAYWQVRYADVNAAAANQSWGRQLVCFKTPDDPIRQRSEADGDLLVTTLYRDGARRPEIMLTGVAYQGYFEPGAGDRPRYPYVVTRSDLPFFAGTGYKPGDRIGDVVGYEWDNTDPAGDAKRLWDPQLSHIKPIDRAGIHVLFTGAPVDVDGQTGRAEAVYFRSEAGAHVFASGSIRWAWGLSKQGFSSNAFRRLNYNMILQFLGRS
jgi:hypothetical protein